MEKITTTPVNITPKTAQKWHDHITLDLVFKVLNQTFLHPFVAWIVVLCLRAQVTPTDHPAWIIAVGYAGFLTLLTAAQMLNRRLAYGLPREVEPSHEVIVITGGGSGLGQVIAQIYGMRGASVAVLDIKEVSEVEGWDELSGVEYYKCDVGDRKALEMTAKKIENDVSFVSFFFNFYFSNLFKIINIQLCIHTSNVHHTLTMLDILARETNGAHQLRRGVCPWPAAAFTDAGSHEKNNPNQLNGPFPLSADFPAGHVGNKCGRRRSQRGLGPWTSHSCRLIRLLRQQSRSECDAQITRS